MAPAALARHRPPLSYGVNNGSEHQVTTRQRPLKGAWGMTALLFLFMLINFADKVVVGLAGPSIRADPSLNLTARQFGLLGSSFFFLFAVSAVLVGFLANRIQAKHALLVMALVWSLVQFPMLGTVSLEVLIACRIMLGAGEGPAAPVATHALYKWFPDALRGLPTAVISQGSAFGVILAVPALTWIISRYSWHWAFGALGIAGLLWSVLWLIFGREGTLVDPPIADAGGEHVPYRHLLTCPSIIAVCFAGFASYWGLALGLTWFTSYLVDALKFSKEVGGNLTAIPWVFGAAVLLIGGSISQRLKAAGYSSRACRGVLACATVVLGGCILPFVGSMPSPELKVACLVIGSAIGSTIFVVLPMIVSELTPQPQRAAMLAITTSVVTLAGVLAPLIMGSIIEEAVTPIAGYEKGYVILGVLLLIGGTVGLLFIRPEADRKRLALLAVAPPRLASARA